MSEKIEQELAFGKENYRLFAVAAIMVVLGYLLMSGGGSEDPNQFDYEGLFSARRIIIAPITILLGFAVGIYAIIKQPKEK